MIFRSGKIKSGNKEIKVPIHNNKFIYKDVEVRINNDGAVYIIACDTPVEYIYLETDFINTADLLVLGDAWERGYGDLEWKKTDFSRAMPWYFAVYDGVKTYCFGIKTSPNSFCAWHCGNGKIAVRIDVRNGSEDIYLRGRKLKACTVISKVYEYESFDALCDFCKLMCDNPRYSNQPIFGGNDWYCNYGDSSRKKILDMTKKIVECSPKNIPYKPYMVIDDGWEILHCRKSEDQMQYNGGPWKQSNSLFGDMKSLAMEIEKLGAVPGIWIRPLLTKEKVPDECVLRKNADEITLDPSSELTLNIVKEDMKRLNQWGYRLIKHDFSTFDIFEKWGFEMEETSKYSLFFYDKTKTTAEIIKNFYRAIREGAGDEVLIMGCNTFSHLSAGIFDIQRIGDDTSGIDWERVKKYGPNTLAFRIVQHRAFYQADADCIGITKEMPWEANRNWLDVLSKSSTPLFVSIEDDAYTDEVKDEISRAFETTVKAHNRSYPVDWQITPTPKCWKSDFGTDCYEW